MKLSSNFSIPAPPAMVFDRFLDPDTMRACIPGCEEFSRDGEHRYVGRLVSTVAHVRFDAAFSAEITDLQPHRRVQAVLRGEDRRLASALKVDAVLDVEPDGGASRVGYSMEMAMWGKLGRMGESIFRRRTLEVERQFVEAFTLACSDPASVPAGRAVAGSSPVSRTGLSTPEPGTGPAHPHRPGGPPRILRPGEQEPVWAPEPAPTADHATAPTAPVSRRRRRWRSRRVTVVRGMLRGVEGALQRVHTVLSRLDEGAS